MKRLLIAIACLVSLGVQGQDKPLSLRKTPSGIFYSLTPEAVRDTFPSFRLTGITNGMLPVYNSTTKKWHATAFSIGILPGLLDSLGNKANRNFSNVASGAIAKAKADTSSSGLLPKSNLFPLGDTRYQKLSNQLNGTGIVEMSGTNPSYLSSTGTGNVVKATSPTLVTPDIGAAGGSSLVLGTTSRSAKNESYISTGGIPTIDSIGVRNQTNFLANNDGYINNTSQVGFGYTTPSNTYVPAAIGMVTTNQGGNTYGDVFIATRNVNTDTKPTVGVWLRSGGIIQLPNLSGSITDMVTIDNAGNLGRTAIPSGGGGGTVASVGVSSANGFAGSSSGGANPSLTLSTTVTGILKGNGTAMSAAVAADFPTLNQNTTGTAAYATAAGLWDTYGGVYSSGTIGYGLIFNNTTNKVESATGSNVKSFLSLGNVDNTSDINKPVSTAQQTALDLKANLASPTFTGTVTAPVFSGDLTGTASYATAAAQWDTYGGVYSSGTIGYGLIFNNTTNKVESATGSNVKSFLSLGNVDNTSDINKPVSTAQQSALDLKANLASPTFTGTPSLPSGTTGITQTAGDNSTKIATTAYADAVGALGAGSSKQVAVIYTDVNSSSGGAIDLAQHSVSTANNGDKIQFEYSGKFAANTNSKPQMILTVDGTNFTIPSITPGNNESWIITGSIIRVSTTLYKISFNYYQSGQNNYPQVTSGATIDTNTLVITLTAPTTVANNDIVLSTASIQKFNAP